MKSLTKKALMLALAIAVVCSFAVFAASDITGTSATLGENGTSVAVAYTAPATASQVTILVFKTANGGDSTDTIGTAPVINADGTTNIVYIDQKANAQSLNFSLRSTDGDGTYKVLIGGTGVAEAATAEFTKASVVAGPKTISGTVGPLAYIEGEDEYNGTFAAVAQLMNEEFEVLREVAVDSTDKDGLYGKFSIDVDGIDNGKYVVALVMPGKCMKLIAVTIADESIELGQKTLVGCDVDGSAIVEPVDVSTVYIAYQNNAAFGDDIYNAECDADANGAIEPVDVSTVFLAYQAGPQAYHEGMGYLLGYED